MGIYLIALKRTDTVARYIDRSQEKERCTHAESIYLETLDEWEMMLYMLYILYIGNNKTKCIIEL